MRGTKRQAWCEGGEKLAPEPLCGVGIDRCIGELATRQHGVVDIDQLRELGLAAGGLDGRVAAGRLHRIHHGVYAVGHPVLTREGVWMAAVLAAGEGAVLSHASAAALWDIRPSLRPRVHVTAPTYTGRKPRRGVATHRSVTLTPEQRDVRSGIPVTSVARTLFDIAVGAGATTGTLERAIHAAVTAGIFDLGAVVRILDERPRRAGSRAMRACLGLGIAETRSDLEARFLDLCVAHGIERPRVNTVVGEMEVDFLWPRALLVVETDGYRYHGDRAAFERDRSRDATLALMGYSVLRFSYRQVSDEAPVVADTICSLLRRGAASPLYAG